jgi:hypothetical protein
MKFSPVSLVGNIEGYRRWLWSEQSAPLSESKQLYSALKIRGIDSVLVEVPGAAQYFQGGPWLTKIDHILAFAESIHQTKRSG